MHLAYSLIFPSKELTYWGRDKMAATEINFKGPINDIPTLVQIMAWRWPGDKLLWFDYRRKCASLGLNL